MSPAWKTSCGARGPSWSVRSERGDRPVAATYRLGATRRLANTLIRGLLRLGLGPPRTYLLTVAGRKTGRPLSTPVTLVEMGGHRWLVAPYGEVGWVRNLRAAGRATLARGRRAEAVTVRPLDAAESAPVLRRYITDVPITRPYFDVRPDSPLEAFVAEAPRHPVFLLGSRPSDTR
jgi:deazaflavin-dependent oxidoreductase (nitroreductase family)